MIFTTEGTEFTEEKQAEDVDAAGCAVNNVA
ncbi:MAG: hypothetical protein ACJAV3_000943 [Alcanivorax sp.]|jgi:hypothetical protein